jgi:hypothetical protein
MVRREIKEKIMPAVSKKQRKVSGIASAIQAGEMKGKPGMPATEMAASMKSGDLHKFASTPQKGLPEKAPKPKGMKVRHIGNAVEKMPFKD